MQRLNFNQSIKPLLFVSMLAATLSFGAPSSARASGPIVVNPSSSSWVFYSENATSSGSFVTGPAGAPLGTGSAELTVDGNGRHNLATAQFSGTPFAQITNLQYSTYRSSTDNGNIFAIALQLDVDYDLTDANLAWQGRLVFEPYFTPASVPQNTWQTWSPLNGKWWASNTTASGNQCGQNTPCTWSEVLANFPNAGIRTSNGVLQFRAGGPWGSGFTGNVDAFTIGINSVDTTFDFEPAPPCTTTCYVDAVNGNDSNTGISTVTAFKTIQKAIDTVQAGGTVRVLPGNYNETATNRMVLGNNGPHQFGLYVGSDKNGISIIGVDATDAPIIVAANAVASITTNATNNFGASGIFVEGDNVTVQGLKILNNLPEDNKTIEIIGDGFTLKDSVIDVPGGGSVYFGDFRFDTGTNTSHIQSYTVEGNQFLHGTSVDIVNGAGYTGPATGRNIKNNVFVMDTGAYWPAIGFTGSGTGVGWYVYSVGGAVITGNTFSGGEQYIRARGTYDNTQFDWQSYWNNNTYDKAVVALVSESPFNVRDYAYTSGSYTFNTTRRIGAVIQPEVNNAQAGDTVLVKSGTYPEAVNINKANLIVKGAGASVTSIVGPKVSVLPGADTLTFSAGGATLDGFTITRDGNNVADWADTRNQGVSFNSGGNTLKNSIVTGNRTGVLIAAGGNTLDSNDITNNRTGVHIINQAGNNTIKNNHITNNWTIGLLYRQDVSTAGDVVTLNDITGNWYSQVDDRGNPAGLTRMLEQNYFGVAPFSVVQQPNSGEPGYASQIPVQFGGTATPPASSPVFVVNVLDPNPNGDTGGRGNANASRLDFDPWLCDGTDTSASIGFQPNPTPLCTTPGSIALTKVVNWDGAAVNNAQTFQLCVSGGTLASPICQNFGANGGTQTVGNLPPGNYTITESDPGSAWTVTGNNATVVVASNVTASGTITNQLKRGSIDITKVVNWNGIAVDNSQTFSICLSGPSFASPDCKSFGANGGTQTWSNVIAGNYTVSEADPGANWTVTGNNANVVLAAGGTANATVTNAFRVASLKVTKSVNWSGTPPTAATFQICISGPTYSTPNCKTFSAGQDQTWSPLIAGNYTVTETDPGANWSVSGTGNVAVAAGSNAVTTVTNTFRAASLTVTKTVNWNSAPPASGTSFQICVTGPSFTAPNCKSFGASGGAQTWSALIPGNYTVVETNPGANWTVTGNNAVVSIAPAQAATARIVNVLIPGTLKVVKVVNTNGATGLSQTFSICVTGPSYAAPDCKTVGIAGGTLQWGPVVPGNYSVVETAPGGNWTVSGNNVSVTVNPAQTGSTTLTNTYQPPPPAFACSVLDNFNRANGKPGSNWAGDASDYRVKDNTATLNDDWGDIILWNRAPATFGANQVACMTLTKIATSSEKHALILKAQGTNASAGMIKVAYVPKFKRVDVWSIQPGQGWVKRTTINNVTMVNGDRLGAQALADGSVRVFRNGTLIGTSTTSSYFVNRTGRIGVWFLNAEGARFDDFGGGTFTP